MKTSAAFNIVALASLAFCWSAHAECNFPKAPDAIPDGKTATEQEMMTAMQAFKAYNEEVTAFGTCIGEGANKSASAAQLMQIKTMQSKKHAAAVEELQAKAKLFNEQVRIFKSRG